MTAWQSIVRLLVLDQVEELGRNPWQAAGDLDAIEADLLGGEYVEWREWELLPGAGDDEAGDD